MNHKLRIAILAVAFLFTAGVVSQAQITPQSIDEQIKQKEAELQRLKEIKLRLDKINQLQDEIKQLQAGQEANPTATAQPSSAARPSANSSTTVSTPVTTPQRARSSGTMAGTPPSTT